MLAIAAACSSGKLRAEIVTVIAPNDSSAAVAAARELDLHVDVVDPGDGYGARLLLALVDYCELPEPPSPNPLPPPGTRHPARGRGLAVDFICLAGYMRLLPSEVLELFPRRILNIHPALLPKHGGKGMYGHHVHEAVLAAGDAESGASVHYVTENYDEGDVILQRRCPVLPDDTPETLAARVLVEEHEAYVEALRLMIAKLNTSDGSDKSERESGCGL